MYVKPRHGLILAGVPRKGVEMPDALAREWIANGLVVPADNADQPRPRAARAKTAKETD